MCTARIFCELLKAKPFMLASNFWEKSLNSVNVLPRSISGCRLLNNTLKIACVAQALLITYIRQTKNTLLTTYNILQYITSIILFNKVYTSI